MLPSLTVAFTAGLLVGSQISYFPLSASFLLLLIALSAAVLERLNRFSIHQATWLYGALLVGVVYWAVAVTLPSPTRCSDASEQGERVYLYHCMRKTRCASRGTRVRASLRRPVKDNEGC